jgi:hypothetical protein
VLAVLEKRLLEIRDVEGLREETVETIQSALVEMERVEAAAGEKA